MSENSPDIEAQNQRSEASVSDNPGVLIPPPFVVAFWLLAGLYLNAELDYVFPAFNTIWMGLGAILLGLALILVLISFFSFKRHKTSLIPHKPDTHLMTKGLFKYSRNPIYLAFIIVFIGAAFFMDAPLALLFLPLVWLYLRFRVIKKEEAYLTRKFGTTYTDYKARTRRWI